MAPTTLYLVLDCYPDVESDAFRDLAGAAVGCWIRHGTCSAEEADAFVKEKLSIAGWTIARALAREEVSADTYAKKSEGREFFEQAQIDGFVANFHVRSRELITKGNTPDDSLVEALVRVADFIGRNGAVSLFHTNERQWANGVTAEGDDFVPLWATEDEASGWLEDWPECEMRRITADDLRSSGFFEAVNSADMWIGLGVGTSLLAMAHPGWVRDRGAARLGGPHL